MRSKALNRLGLRNDEHTRAGWIVGWTSKPVHLLLQPLLPPPGGPLDGQATHRRSSPCVRDRVIAGVVSPRRITEGEAEIGLSAPLPRSGGCLRPDETYRR
jgi:hypothetical protein